MAADRSSEADEPILLADRQEIARVEAENTLRQFDAAMKELQGWLRNPAYRLKPSSILSLNRIALTKLSKFAGVFRPSDIKISGSKHQPVAAEQVPRLVEEFCEYVNDNWRQKSAVHLSAYALWRLNWIHPFVDGNGRTSRIVSYIILCAKLGYRLPGTKTIPEQIALNKTPYYKALEAADKASKSGRINVSTLEALIDAHLATQLYEVHKNATSGNLGDRQATAALAGITAPEGNADRNTGQGLARVIAWIEKHPALTGLIGAILAAILAIAFAR